MNFNKTISFAVSSLFFACFIYLFLSLLSFNQIEEDTYIYMKTAANIAEGYGYVFNRTEAPIETGSSTIWQYLLACLYFFPGYFVVNIKFMGMIIGCLSLLLTYSISHSLNPSTRLHFLPVLMTAVNIPFVTYNQAGLDYGLATLTYLFFCWLCIDQSRFRFWPIGALLILLVRSEGFLLLFVLSPVLFIQAQGRAKKIAGVCIVSIAFIFLELIRLYYFKDYMPSPFYLKMDASGADWRIARDFWKTHHLLYLSIPVVVAVLLGGLRKKGYLILLIFIICIVYWACLSQDIIRWTRRVLPAIPLVYILASHAVLSIVTRLSRGKVRVICKALAVVCLVVVAGYLTNPPHFFAHKVHKNMHAWLASQLLVHKSVYLRAVIQKIQKPYDFTLLDTEVGAARSIGTNYQVLTGKFINLNYPEGITIIYDQMGQTPYFSGLNNTVVDSFGLTDRSTGYYNYWKKIDGGVHGFYARILEVTQSLIAPTLSIPKDEKSGVNYLIGRDADLILVNMIVINWSGTDTLTAKILKYAVESSRYVCPITLNSFIVVCEKKGLREGEYSIPEGLDVKAVDVEGLQSFVSKITFPEIVK